MIKKCHDAVNKQEPMVLVLGSYSLRLSATDAHKLLLRIYLLRVSTLYFVQTIMEIRKLAQVCAVKPEYNILMSWAEYECARKLFESSSTTISNKS